MARPVVDINRENKSRRCCCVVGCKNTKRKNPEITFYSFPNRPWEVERKKKWIAALRRITIHKKPWEPSKNSVICSGHFVGGEKSNDPRKESFYPTIFPSIYENNVSEVSKAVRSKTGMERIDAYENGINNFNSHEDPYQPIAKITNEIGIQTNFYIEDTGEVRFSVSFCWRNESSNEASTQTNIIIDNGVDTFVRKINITRSIATMTNTAVFSERDLNSGFLGFKDINDDFAMEELTGISLSFFSILSKFIEPGKCGQPTHFKTLNRENRLLLFLMRMKLALSFTALGCLFKISKTTVSKVFFAVLDSLLFHTKTWISWPSKEAIRKNMPSVLKSYSNCRAIIHCVEFQCDSLLPAEQRASMYSNNKFHFLVKFLIAISPCGMITFISKGYGARVTDEFIVNDSGFVNLIESGDEILANKKFPQIESELLKRRCSLVMIPPFDFNPQEKILEECSIASVQIHIEKVIQRVKIYKIFKQINSELLQNIDKIMYMACILANNKEPIDQMN